jgi:hypothetical protein
MRNIILAVSAALAFAFSPAAQAQEEAAAPAPEEAAAPAPEEAAAPAPEASATEAVEAAAPVPEEAAASDVEEADVEVEEAPTPPVPTEEATPVEEAVAPATDAEALEVAGSLFEALKGKQWPLAAGLFLSLLVYLVNRFSPKDLVPDKWEPMLSFGVGAAAAMGTALAMGGAVIESLVAGVAAGLASVGGWEIILRQLTTKKKPEASPL